MVVDLVGILLVHWDPKDCDSELSFSVRHCKSNPSAWMVTNLHSPFPVGSYDKILLVWMVTNSHSLFPVGSYDMSLLVWTATNPR